MIAYTGDLEITILFKFGIASGLKGLASSGQLPPELVELAEILEETIHSFGLGGLARGDSGETETGSSSWDVSPSVNPPSSAVQRSLRRLFSATSPDDLPTGELLVLETISRATMSFSIGKRSSHDSQISYRGAPGSALCFGRIKAIIAWTCKEPDEDVATIHKIIAVVERYQPLSPAHQSRDPYYNHPIVGVGGYNICRLVYDEFSPSHDIISVDDIVGHISRCSLEGDQFSISKPVIFVSQLDPVSIP